MSISTYVKGAACIANIHPAEVSAFFMDSMLALVEHEAACLGQPPERISLLSGPRIASARNQVAAEFLNERQSEWLVMVDADMVFAPDTIRVMIREAVEKGAKIVGALCYGATPTGWMNPTIFRLEEDARGKRYIRFDQPPPKDTMIRCSATGTGFILIHRDVLAGIWDLMHGKTPWIWFGEEKMSYDGEWFEVGEDIGFCMRAQAAGHEVWVCTGVEVHHAKVQIMTPRHFRRHLRDLKEGVTHEDRIHEALLHTRQPRES